jgi:hypothetical protein
VTGPLDYAGLARRLRFEARQIRPTTASQSEMNEVRDGLVMTLDSLATLTERIAEIDHRRS